MRPWETKDNDILTSQLNQICYMEFSDILFNAFYQYNKEYNTLCYIITI